MHALDAKIAADKANKQNMLPIYTAIKTEAEKGNYVCYWIHKLNPDSIAELRSMGYEVQNNSSQKDGELFIIEWKNA